MLKNTDYGLSALKSAIGSSSGGGQTGCGSVCVSPLAEIPANTSTFTTVLDITGCGNLYSALFFGYASSSKGQTIKILVDDEVLLWTTYLSNSSSSGFYHGGIISSHSLYPYADSNYCITVPSVYGGTPRISTSSFDFSLGSNEQSWTVPVSTDYIYLIGVLIPGFISFNKSVKIMILNNYSQVCKFRSMYTLNG